MSIFTAVTDKNIVDIINKTRTQLVMVTPALSGIVAKAVKETTNRTTELKVVLILDSDEDAYRVGYGDQQGTEILKELANSGNVSIRSQQGLRMGLLITDGSILFWSPTPKSVESERAPEQPNGIHIDKGSDVEKQLKQAVKLDAPKAELADAEIGCNTLDTEQVAKIDDALKNNPPAPVDLSKMARVFSTKIQFVECTLRGAQWTEREIKVSNLLLNADVPEDFKELFDTKIRPFSKQTDIAIPVQAIIQGQLAYDKDGNKLKESLTQTQIRKIWEDIQKRYIIRLKHFGLLIRRADKPAFETEIAAFESVLKSWVEGFRNIVKNDEEDLIEQISKVVELRLKSMPSSQKPPFNKEKIKNMISNGLQGIRVIKPSVKLVFKNISWESTGDKEFCMALEKGLPPQDLKGWFSVYSAAPEKSDQQPNNPDNPPRMP